MHTNGTVMPASFRVLVLGPSKWVHTCY